MDRVEEQDLPDLSCTDVEQEWGKLKNSHGVKFQATRTKDLCHVPHKPLADSRTPEQKAAYHEFCRNILLNCKCYKNNVIEKLY